jgi:raffinose/stachyose/melibiose transport system permease protein
MITQSGFFPRISQWISLLLLLGLLLLMLFPLLLVTMNSFKTEAEYYDKGPFALPEQVNLDALRLMWKSTDYTTKLSNSLIISGSVAALAITLSLMNAVALGIGRTKGKTFFLVFFLMAIMLPIESLVYPLYYFFKYVGLYDTRISLILITAVLHSAFGTYLLTSVLGTFSRDIIEAALIDGCDKLQLVWHIIVPLSRPALSILFVFFFIWTWNDFFLPLIFLVSNSNQTVPLAMALARGERGAVVTTQSASALLGIIPALLFFLLFQRTLTRGILAGSVK